MASFPRIQGPCPYLDRLDAVIDDGFCRMCRRDVHDLTAMDERERADFVANCGDVCVSYTMQVKPAVAAALIAASAAVLVAPEATLAKHPAIRAHPQHQPRPVQPPPVLLRTAGIIAPPPDWNAQVHRPPVTTVPSKKPD
jgi:hypothetical protein